MSRMPFRGGMPQPGAEMAGGGPLQRARFALMNNQPAVAADICQRRLERKPDETPTRLLLAQALVQLQQPREAAREARRVLEAQQNNVDALMILSQALLGANQMNPPKEALTSAQRAVQLQPRNARTHVQLAEVLMMQRQFDQASAEADEAVRLDQRLGAAYMVKGMSALNAKDYEGSEQAFRAALRQDRTMSPAYFGMAQALSNLNKPDEALEAVNKAQQLNPNLPEGQVTQLRAQIYRKQRKYGAAYNEYLRMANKSGRNRFAPVLAASSFFLSFFGQAAPVVLIVILLLVLFGISRIPAVGGILTDILVVGLLGFLGWNVVRMSSGASPLQRLLQPQARILTAGALVGGLVVVFGLFALFGYLFGPHHHYFWFTTLSVGVAAAVAVILATLALNFGPGASRS